MGQPISPKPRRLRTWSAFGDLRRVPTEYEIVTHDTNYTLRKGRTAAFESNPTTPANMWYLTYRDKSPVQVPEWNDFRDPDEMTYRKYVTVQNGQERVVESVLDKYQGVAHDAQIAPRWMNTLCHLFVPTRYLVHGLQITQAYLGTIAPSSYITNCAAFCAADLLRRGSLVSYRTVQLQKAQPAVALLGEARSLWEEHPDWQPARKAIEMSLIAYDWAECLTAVNIVLRPALDEVLLHQLGMLARKNDDECSWLLLTNLSGDSERARRWSTALVKFAIERNGKNRDVFQRWIDRWRPRAQEAAAGLARMLETLPKTSQTSVTTFKASCASVARSLADAGLTPLPSTREAN
jgi:hypothetical protein